MTTTDPVTEMNQFRKSRNSYEANPIIDGGAPYSTSDLEKRYKVCNSLSIELYIETPGKVYQHGWGQGYPDLKMVTGIWYYSTSEIKGETTVIPLDIVNESSPMIKRPKLEKYSDD